MTEGGIFREIFVELSEQAMLAAQAAIEKLTKVHAPVNPPQRHEPSVREVIAIIARGRYGWNVDSESVLLDPYHDAIWLKFRDGCRHRQRMWIPAEVYYRESAMPSRVAALIAFIDSHRHERRCSCVVRAEAA